MVNLANTDGVEWHVLSNGQRLDTRIDESGRNFTEVWEVPYQIDSGPAQGTQGMVRIPAAQYNAEMVRQTIAAQVKHLHEVAGL